MNHWIFQSVVDRYDLRKPDVVQIGKKDIWYSTRYISKMSAGDKVFFWLGGLGSERGIYAVGHLVSETYKKAGWDSAGIDVVYDSRVTPPLLVEEIKANKYLKNLLILRAAQATNFLLEDDEANELTKLIKDRKGQ